MIPMLPDAFAPHKIIYPVLVQPKVSGQHVLYQAGWFTNENDVPLEGRFANLTLPLMDMFSERTILDGVLKDDTFIVFDVVASKIPYKERSDTIAQVLRDTNKYQHKITFVPTRKMFNEEQADDQYHVWLGEGYTGMIYRLGNCYYTKPSSKNKFNRNKQLLLRCEKLDYQTENSQK